jgi:hypothetical protein
VGRCGRHLTRTSVQRVVHRRENLIDPEQSWRSSLRVQGA